jgi:hypothetical protein
MIDPINVLLVEGDDIDRMMVRRAPKSTSDRFRTFDPLPDRKLDRNSKPGF